MAEFEERADQLSKEDIGHSMADGRIFKNARAKLLASGAKLLVGPRGTGKTHLMRFTYLAALKDASAPLAFYATFNRYLNLEPLLKKSPDALKRFHSWVVAKLLLSAFDCVADLEENAAFLETCDPLFDEAKLRELVSLLERGSGDAEYELIGKNLTVDHAIRAINTVTAKYSRSRAVLLLDDAALSLADQYLVSFFEIFRLLKTEKIAPKASVYPGSTQYGPSFHASHEAEEIPLWLSVEDAEYLQIMGDIAGHRLTSDEIRSINTDTLDLFKYVAFGSPRVFLRLLREYLESNPGTSQQKINKIVEKQASLLGDEYDSLRLKLKQYSSLISTGRRFFDKAVVDVAAAQAADLSARNVVLGIRQEKDRSPLADRMIRFLVEVGLLFPLQSVSHGENRKYDRYVPHFAFLFQEGAFREGKKATIGGMAAVMARPASKHPIRRDFSTLLTPAEMLHIKLDLPPCQHCGTQRINDSQRFCHQCGAELVASSLFEGCMKLRLEEIPGISSALIARINADTQLRTVEHVLNSQNAYGELQQANYVGPVRAEGIIRRVTLTVNEFLS